MNHDDKLDRWAQRELERNIQNVIIQDAQGQVFAFGRYVISTESQGARVTKYGSDIAVFTSRAAAMSWCVADQNNLLNLARRVTTLDSTKRLLQQDIDARKIMAQRSRDPDFRERVLTKISTKQILLDQVRAELTELMSQAKYIQLQGSQHETSRTRRA